MTPTLHEELRLLRQRITFIAGIDEVGRGCWAGPVVAAAVVLPVKRLRREPRLLKGVDDSKKLSPTRREEMDERIREVALGAAVGLVPPELIDILGIVPATHLAMRLALSRLPVSPEYLLVDGPARLGVSTPQRAIVDGDALCLSIAAASIVAKVYRDRLMVALAEFYPEYGFEQHKGYGTKQHQEALERWGVCPLHRRSFAPIRELLQEEKSRQSPVASPRSPVASPQSPDIGYEVSG